MCQTVVHHEVTPAARWRGAILITILTLVGFLLPSTAKTQVVPIPGEDKQPAAKTQILTRPPGALVLLEGEYGLAGRAPYTITHLLRGQYRIKARMAGFEEWSGHYVFTGRGNEKLSIKLTPKTRLKAFIRSAILPGWGQSYADQRLKGFVIAVAQFGALGELLYHEARYRDALDASRQASRALQEGMKTGQGVMELELALQAAQDQLSERYDSRRRWALISASVYLFNLFDAVVFFPSYHRNGLDLRLTISPPAEPFENSGQLSVQARF